jgi:hypothetical protein
MNQRRNKQGSIFLSFLLGLALLLSSCAPANQPSIRALEQPAQTQTLVNPDPFVTTMQGEDGILVELRGDTRGHLPGAVSTFLLDVHNETGETWEGSYCLQLVDRTGVVETLAAEAFSLQSEQGFGTLLNARFPEDLSEEAYGLTLIFPDRFETVTKVYVGENMTADGGPWPQGACP